MAISIFSSVAIFTHFKDPSLNSISRFCPLESIMCPPTISHGYRGTANPPANSGQTGIISFPLIYDTTFSLYGNNYSNVILNVADISAALDGLDFQVMYDSGVIYNTYKIHRKSKSFYYSVSFYIHL